MGDIIGNLIRMEKYSTHIKDLTNSIKLMDKELKTLAYTGALLKRALQKLTSTRPETWTKITKHKSLKMVMDNQTH